MPQNPAGRWDLNDPIYGTDMSYFRVGDIPSASNPAIVGLTNVVASTTSAALSPNARGMQVLVQFSTPDTQCDIQVFRVDPGPVDTLIATFTGININNTDTLYVTGNEGYVLDGKQVKVRAQNITGAGNVSIQVRAN